LNGLTVTIDDVLVSLDDVVQIAVLETGDVIIFV
jgi:hypothetical protein